MYTYILNDLKAALYYLPYGLVAGVIFCLLAAAVNKKTKPIVFWGRVAFVMYLAILLVITLLSRESGTGKDIDLQLFSTWGINERNNALVIENVLLFVPYGIVCAWAFKPLRHLITSLLAGGLTSVVIEMTQHITNRGFFQLDDIVTNIIGCGIGFICFWIVTLPVRCVMSHKAKKSGKIKLMEKTKVSDQKKKADQKKADQTKQSRHYA